MDPAGIYRVSYEQDMSIVRTKTQWLILIFAIVAAFYGPLYLPKEIINVAALLSCIIISTMGLRSLPGTQGKSLSVKLLFFV